MSAQSHRLVKQERPPEDASRPDDKRQIYEAVREIAEKRAVIEQAKGMLMFVYAIDEDAAFEVLRLHSQQLNVKVRVLAEQIVRDLAELAKSQPPRDRLEQDRVLLSAHRRIAELTHRGHDGQSKTGT